MKPLTPKQTRFVEEFMLDANGAAAARRAGYSQRTADRIGERLLRNVEIRKAIGKARKEQSRRLEITADRVIQAVGALAFAENGKASDKLKALEILAKHFGLLVKKIELTNGGGVLLCPGTLDPKDWDKAAASHYALIAEKKNGGG